MSVFRMTLFVSVVALILVSCQPKTVKKTVTPKPVPQVQHRIPALPDSAAVLADSENVRQSPNGKVIERLYKNEIVYPEERIGNWVKFHSFYIDSGYVWAPSIGLKQINLYSPENYYDSTYQAFYPVSYFRKFFDTKGVKKKVSPSEYELFFSGIGLGSHEEVVFDVTNRSTEEIRHGVTVFLNRTDTTSQTAATIYQVKVDFYKPIRGVAAALKKCGLPDQPFSQQNESKVIWSAGKLIPGLEVELERKEWKSSDFSAVWYRLRD